MKLLILMTSVLNLVSAGCQKVTTMGAALNQTEFIRASWYVQEQQPTKYQKANALFCVTATYNLGKQEGKKVPFFSGTVLAVHNYDNVGGVGMPSDNANNKTVLCGRQPDAKDPSKLLVAPCFLPNLLAGDYWVLGAGPSSNNYEWTVISGGQPTEQYDDGCTTKVNAINGAGLWIFSRDPIMSELNMAAAKAVLKSQGYSLSQLVKVPQEGCKYDGAFIKPNSITANKQQNVETQLQQSMW